MKTWIWAAAVAVSLLVGIRIGAYAFAADSPPDVPPASNAAQPKPQPQKPADNPADPDPAPEGKKPTPAEPAPEPDAKAPAPVAPPATLLDMLKAVSVGEAAKGSGVISGRVLDLAQKPVKGVVVRLAPSRVRRANSRAFPPSYGAAQSWDRVEDDLKSMARLRANWDRKELHFVTGEDGTFKATGLGEKSYLITGQHPDYAIEQLFRDELQYPGNYVLLRATPLETVRIRATLPEGVSADDCTVWAYDPHQHVSQYPTLQRTDDGWSVKVPPGVQAFSLSRPDTWMFGNIVMKQIVTGEGPYEVHLSFDEGKTVRGRVTINGPQPLDPVSVTLVPTQDPERRGGPRRHDPWLQQLNAPVWGGSYEVAHVMPGTYTAELRIGGSVMERKEITFEGKKMDLDFTLNAPTEGIICSVFSLRNKIPLQPTFELRKPGGHSVGYARLWDMGQGEFLLVPLSENVPVPVELCARDAGGEEVRIKLEHLGPQRIDIVFPRRRVVAIKTVGGSLPIRTTMYASILGDDQKPVAGQAFSEPHISHGHGDYRVIREVPAGQWRLEVAVGGNSWPERIQIYNKTIVVPEEGMIIELPIPELHSVEIVVPRHNLAFLTLTGTHENGTIERQLNWQNGNIKADGLPKGDYKLSWRVDGLRQEHERKFKVPDTETIDLTKR